MNSARIVRLVIGVFLSLVVLGFLAVQTDQRMLRWRAGRLLADMHGIRLYQSNWADAQRLMHRWGAWGHYDGSCTSESCRYEIAMNNICSYNPRVPRHAWLDWLLAHDRLNIYQWFGGRSSRFYASFTVHDGTIWREDTSISVSVPRRRVRRNIGADKILVFDDFDKSLSMGAVSYQRLHKTLKNRMVYMGNEDELAQHPYYKVGRPGGCTINCQIGVVYYSTHTPPAEIERLTSYDFSCFTRFNPCKELEDLLPAANEWHLYKEDEIKQSPVKSCDIPVWAQARDARYVLSVEAISSRIGKEDKRYSEDEAVRVVGSLKEPAPWLPNAVADIQPDVNEHLIPGRRYIVFAIGNDRRDQIVTKNSPIRFERCGLQEDTPEIRRELEKGFAQNDTLNP